MSRTLPGLAAVLAALALAGCGGGSTATVSFAEAADATQSTDTMRFSMTGTITADGESSTMEGEGATDTRAGRTEFTLTMPGLDMEAVMADTKIYIRMPTLKDELPGLKPWIELDLQKLGEAAGVDFQSLVDLGNQGDPLKLLGYLRAAGSVEEIGSEEIRGVETTHYRSDVDLSRYADVLADENPRAAKSLRALIRDAGGEVVVPLDVWIDEDGLVRRQSFEQSMPDGSSMQMTIDLYDFGADVDVALPPRADVTSFDELLEKVGG
jgi:hypothetical protein